MDRDDLAIPTSREELRELQWRRLEVQLDRVFASSPFYQRKFAALGIERGDIRSFADFGRLPLTTKDELRADQEAHAPYGSTLCVDPTEVSWLPSTSGSSGRPVILPRTRRDIERWSRLAARMCEMNGVRPGDRYQLIMAFQWIFTGMVLHEGVIRAGGASINAGMGNTERQIWTLQNLAPRSVFATPAYFMHLASELERRDLADKLAVQIAVSGGEIGASLPEWKALLKKRIPSLTTVCDVGGVTEIGTPLWSECVHEAGPHVFEDAVLVEILDQQTGSPSAYGEVIYTDLIGEAAPLLRYEVRDVAHLIDESCECGVPFARYKGGVIGRSDDMLTVNSANVFPSAIEACVRDVDGLSGEYQIVVAKRGEVDLLTLRVEREAASTHSDPHVIERLKAKLAIATPVHPAIELVAFGELPRFVYKSKRIADERKNETVADLAALAESQQRM